MTQRDLIEHGARSKDRDDAIRENNASNTVLESEARVSAAISLKRIADALEGSTDRHGINDIGATLARIELNTRNGENHS
jgi:hypothetical protein